MQNITNRPQAQNSILQEILEFGITVIWLGIAFGIAIGGGIKAFSDLTNLRSVIIESLVVVFFAFVFHELAHRMFARRYDFKAVYHLWIPGLLLAIGSALIGFLFAAPGAVHIEMSRDTTDIRAKMGKSALAGPIANVILSFIFFGLFTAFVYYLQNDAPDFDTLSEQKITMIDIAWGICIIGIEINGWLAFFNLIPFGNFDGFKVFMWSKKVWGVAFGGSIGIYFLLSWLQNMLIG
jgi:Zn-dependent protease